MRLSGSAQTIESDDGSLDTNAAPRPAATPGRAPTERVGVSWGKRSSGIHPASLAAPTQKPRAQSQLCL